MVPHAPPPPRVSAVEIEIFPPRGEISNEPKTTMSDMEWIRHTTSCLRLSEIHFNVPSQTSLLVQQGSKGITSEREIESGPLINE